MANNPTLLAMPLAENGQKNTIPVTQEAAGDGLFSQSTGFPPETALPLGAGGVAPKREDFNGAFNVLSDIAFYAQKGWVFKWDAGQAYFKGCEVIDPADGLKYRCIQDVEAGGDAPNEDEAVHWWPVIEGASIGSVMMCLSTTIPDGWLSCENGQEVPRAAFPQLWAWVQDNAPLITEAEWQAKASAQKSVGYYSSGDGSTTFRLPRLLGFAEGVAAADVGKFTGAGLPNITGDAYGSRRADSYTSSEGALYWGASDAREAWAIDFSKLVSADISLDASRSNPIYGNSATVQPESVGMVWCVRAFGAATNQGTVDITALAQSLNLKQDKATVRNDAGGLIDLVNVNNYTGYAKYGTTSGKNLIIQWGISDVYGNITFPISFTAADSYRVAVAAASDSAQYASFADATAYSATLALSAQMSCSYIAIGY